MIRKLYQLRNGQSGFVAAVAATGERASAFGTWDCFPVSGLRSWGVPRWGSPVLRVMGTTLALRVADAEDVTVSTDD